MEENTRYAAFVCEIGQFMGRIGFPRLAAGAALALASLISLQLSWIHEDLQEISRDQVKSVAATHDWHINDIQRKRLQSSVNVHEVETVNKIDLVETINRVQEVDTVNTVESVSEVTDTVPVHIER